MRKLTGRFRRPPILAAETPKGPWGGSGEDSDGGPRNPWAVPPGGRKAPAKPTALDEFIRKARGSGGGGPGEGPGGSGGGFGGLPGAPGGRTLWAIGAAILVGIWLLYTSIHPIGPQQRGVVTYFGRYTGVLEPGIQLTAPAPIAAVRVLDVQKIRTENFPEGSGENLVLTGDQNIIDLTYSVRWDIANPRDFAFRLAQPQETVRAAAESAMRAVIAETTLDQALGSGRTGIEQRVQELTQSILNEYRSGVRIQGVAIKQAAPPQQIVDDFNKVTAAQQRAVADVNQAKSYAQQVIARAQGEAAQFDKVYEQYRLAPEVTRRRMYYETMEAVLAKSDKTIVEAPGVVPYLPLQKARPAPEMVAPEPAAPVATQGGGQ
ncbi:membrane protease subunit HflK [Sphingomonas sp. SORGH_AS 950]|uniref:protease modulator HflK n=1 Tax=unclassified Sphingomonas TaxID=196159 RepID=UPI00278438C5|nr:MULTISPECIES: protease modulator HflK [unclassified Sphingomonas]MDQ1158325.1 membrane protease subunit HflK [Sphingomonas sp. SORGH_AS_0950]MDR6113795.1 membrane protease subunit HflK [Sphingomonas sp. SORGH_AS_0789]MDR6148845.1 membrane protease subunit HflK [Sphingomonas sp. SORGH_AS_0742]